MRTQPADRLPASRPAHLNQLVTQPGASRRGFMKASALTAFSLGAMATGAAPAMASLLRSRPGAPDEPIPTLLDWGLLIEKMPIHALVDPNSGGNSLLVSSKGKALLVDTKFPYLATAIRADIAAFLGADPTQDNLELTLINTHHHADHTGGNPIIVPAAAASYAHKNAIGRIRSQHERYVQTAKAGPGQLKRQGSEATDPLLKLAMATADASSAWTPNTAVPKIAIEASGNALTIGEIPVKTHHFGPGHTDNDLVVRLPEHNIVHTGDLVFNGLHPFFDRDGGATARGWVASLKQVHALCDENTIVIPGHGQITNRAAIDRQISYIENLVKHVKDEIAKGTPKEQLTEMSWDFMTGLGFEQARPRAIAAVYDELKG